MIPLVALVGFYKDDEDLIVGTLRCKKVVLFYDPKAQVVRFSAKVHEGQCFTPIALYQDSIWSPDSSKLALVLDQRDICIVDVVENSTSCVPITNYFKAENKVWSLTWSPDSNYIAFIRTDGEINVFSLHDHETYKIANVDDLYYLPIGSNSGWVR